MFDEDYFIKSLSTACPQIHILSNVSLLDASISTAAITPKDLGNKFKVDRVMDFAADWRSLFDKWIADFGPDFNRSMPLLVSAEPSWFEWPILYDSALFVATFGRILRFNSTLLNLAATVVYALDEEYNLGIEPAMTGIPMKGKFYGAHLRTAKDAVAASFASYEEQSSAYLSSTTKNNLSLVYLASGSPPDIIRFMQTAAEKNIQVTTKTALLEKKAQFANTLKTLQALTWDQQALIDYMVLLRSSHFGGTWASSFSYNIVFRRHVTVGKGEWIPSASALEARGVSLRNSRSNSDIEDGACYQDGVNTVFGPPKMGIWFELSMWP